MNTASLDLTLISPLAASSFSGSDYWLRMEQVTPEDDTVTTEEIAELVDELYQIDPCIEEETIQTEENPGPQPTPAELVAAVKKKWNIAECNRRKSGTYTARVKIIYSHLDEKYSLKASKGEIDSISRQNEDVTLTINIKEQDKHALDYPVFQPENTEWPVNAQWLGSVFTEKDGAIKPPHITGFGNILTWGVACTGTIIIKFPTAYDLADITVPGIVNQVTQLGTSQESTLTAFYHFQRYELSLEMIHADSTADEAKLAEVCGWSEFTSDGNTSGTGTGTGGGTDGDTDDDDEDNSGPELGCLSPNENLNNPVFYKEVCCYPMTRQMPVCSEFAAVKPGKLMEDGLAARIIASHSNPVNFVGVGPGPEGCGRIITRQNVNRRNCCSDITPLSAHPSNPTHMAASSSILLATQNGNLQDSYWWTWRAGGGLYFDGGRTVAQGGYQRYVHSPAEWCAAATVTVNDGCTGISMRIDNDTPPDPLEIEGDNDHTVAPDGFITLGATGGVWPYTWEGSSDLVLVTEAVATSATFRASSTFCGTGTVYVSDGCGVFTEAKVRSTDGVWDPIYDFDRCNPPGSGTYPAPSTGIQVWVLDAIAGQYKANIRRDYAGGIGGGYTCTPETFFYPLNKLCNIGNSITKTFDAWASAWCTSQGNPPSIVTIYSEGCCKYYAPPNPVVFAQGPVNEACIGVFEWVCPT